ncbi:serine aminopeptidase domain-containing protein [Spiroplasma alleghenense]|uniref:Serine aminopeptidase S33 domain-containing protein n=1 Tax=Spiroplasma alleghenense TaxID=216931 RepID=A0A345Z403_9MOLU|nr:alpha/beta hydrolase [Spiroplasma alleghenense]AXK51332.1 hypothetical protein SALLE_v1c06620 [Spiroplasma alleghenense]
MTFIEAIYIFLYAALGFFAFVALLAIVIKLITFNSLKNKSSKKQIPELVKKKCFINSDQYELNWMGEINPKGEKIILCLHDLGYSSKQFDNLELYMLKNKPLNSVIGFDLRNYGKNKNDDQRNLGAYLSDVKEVVDYISNKYPSQKIIILASGFGTLTIQSIIKHERVEKIILLAICTQLIYSYTLSMRFKIFLGTIFSSQKLINLNYNPADLTDNKSEIKNYQACLEVAGAISVRELFQFRVLSNKFWKSIMENQDKITIIQGDNDKLVNPKIFAKKILGFNKENFKILQNTRHLILSEKQAESIFESI